MKRQFVISVAAIILFAGCQPKTAANTAVSSIKDMLAKSMALKCTFVDPDNNKPTTIYLKNSTIAMEAGADATGEKNLRGLIKDNVFYMWNSATKAGSKAALEKMSAGGTMKVAGKVVSSADDIITAMEPHQKDCQVISDTSMFEVPQDISFKE
jgi:hypothetical protein